MRELKYCKFERMNYDNFDTYRNLFYFLCLSDRFDLSFALGWFCFCLSVVCLIKCVLSVLILFFLFACPDLWFYVLICDFVFESSDL